MDSLLPCDTQFLFTEEGMAKNKSNYIMKHTENIQLMVYPLAQYKKSVVQSKVLSLLVKLTSHC